MASAQQKVKKDPGKRQAGRPNGKAWKRTEDPSNGQIRVVEAVVKVYDGHQPRTEIKSRMMDYIGNGVQVSGRGKKSNCSYKGMGVERQVSRARHLGISVQQLRNDLDKAAISKRQFRKEYSKARRAEMVAARESSVKTELIKKSRKADG